jgi:hypothetical protein
VGGQGEPFYRDLNGFDVAIGMTIEHRKKVFSEKWAIEDATIELLVWYLMMLGSWSMIGRFDFAIEVTYTELPI